MIKEIRHNTLANVCYAIYCDKCNLMYEHYTGETVTDWLGKPGGFKERAINKGWKIDGDKSSALCNKCI